MRVTGDRVVVEIVDVGAGTVVANSEFISMVAASVWGTAVDVEGGDFWKLEIKNY